MTRIRGMKAVFALVGVAFLAAGCATNRTIVIPASYLDTPANKMGVEMKACPSKANLPQVGGGILTMAVLAARRASVSDKFEGISGDTVQDLIQQEIERKLGAHFDVGGTDTPLVTEVTITHWGLNSNSTLVGIKTSGWFFQIIGSATVYDRATKRRTKIGHISAQSTSAALGNDPTPQEVQEAMLKAVDSFSQFVVDTLVKKPATAEMN